MKRSQISFFVIIGLILVILALILFFRNPEIDDYSENAEEFQRAKETFADYSSKCLKLSTEKSLYRYGYGYVHQQMEYYIKKYFFRCMDNFNDFRKQGYDFSYDEPLLTLTIEENKVESVLLLNLEMSKNEQNAFFERFETRFDRPDVNIDGKWIFRGILYKYEETKDPRPMQIFTAKIDLEDPTVRYYVTPKIEPNLMTTSDFLMQNGLQLAVNGQGYNETYPFPIRGFAASGGKIYSASDYKPELSVMITKDKEVSFGANIPGNLEYGISGVNHLVEKGVIWERMYPSHPRYKDSYANLEPRTSFGIDEEDKWLILIVVDGRNPNVSEGATLFELAELFVENHATYAVNADGGGSTTMVIEEGGRYRIINTPSEGAERPVANHLGVYAEKLK
jgi:exopolysaccharide biosynthesis protein